MFGSKSTFGSTGGFGSTTFGTPMPFGQSTSGFGTPAFGTQTTSSSIFGNPSTANTGVGLFGSTNATAFPTNTATNTGFSAFGSSSNTLFGTSQPSTTSGLFSSQATNTAFGAPKPTFGAFGSTPTTGGLFGSLNPTQPQQQQPQQQPNTSLFGSTMSTGLFGNPTASAFGNIAAAPSGTTVKFNPTTGTDTMVKNGLTQNINTRHQCITCMKEYENKSLEELRIEDYLANRKGPQAGSVSTGFGSQSQSLFGSPATSTAYNFGSNKSTFGPTTGGAFGSTTSSLFGQPQQTSQTSSLFGTPKPAFGAATTTATTTPFVFGTNTNSLFNQNNQPKPLFGQSATTQAGSLFGTTSNTQTAPLFGGTSGFTFGASSSNPTTNLFGKSATMGGTNPSTTLSFTNPTQTGSLFGNKSGTSLLGSGTGFGTGNAFGSLSFGSTANTTGSSLFNKSTPAFGTGTLGTGMSNTFGNLNSGPSLFSNTLNKTATGMGTASTGFGTSTLGGTTGLAFGNTANTSLGSDANMAALNAQQMQIQQQILALTNSPFGDSPLFRNISQDSIKRDELLKPTNPAAQKALIAPSHYKVSPLPTTKMKPKPLHSLNGKACLFDGLEEDENSLSSDMFVPRKSLKKLVLKNKSPPRFSGSPNRSLNSVDDSQLDNTPILCLDNVMSQSTINSSILNGISISEADTSIKEASDLSKNNNYNNPVSKPLARIATQGNVSYNSSLNDTIPMILHHHKRVSESSNNYQESDDSEKENISNRDFSELDDNDYPSSGVPNAAGIVLTRQGYYTIPPIDEIAKLMDSDGNCYVDNFTVGREGYGSAFFFGCTNVSNLNLDEIVHFRRKELTIYPDDDDKPPTGQGLNKRAQITLDCVWPTDKTSRAPIKSPERLKVMRYQEKVELAAGRIGGKFIEYRPETGSWVFEVQHFSKYGLQDSDEEDLPLPSEQAQLPPGPVTLQQNQKIEQAQPKQIILQSIEISQALRDDDDSEMADICQETFPEEFPQDSPGVDQEGGESNETAMQRLAHVVGANTSRLKAMKESLFLDDEDLDATSYSKPSPATININIPNLLLSSVETSGDNRMHKRRATGIMKHPVTNLFSGFPEPALLPSSLCQTTRQMKLMGTRCKRGLMPLKDSLIYNKHKLLSDIGCYMGRTCRVGWGPNWTFVHCGSAIGPKPEAKDVQNMKAVSILTLPHQSALTRTPFTIELERVTVAPHLTEEDKSVLVNLEESLEVKYKNSKSFCESKCPHFVPINGVETIDEFSELVVKQLERLGSHADAEALHHTKLVWDLCNALYTQFIGFEDMTEVEKSESYAYHMARRESLSRWLSKSCEGKIENEVQKSKLQSNGHLHAVFSYLTGRQIPAACQASQDMGDNRTALLIAHTMSSQRVNNLIGQQLMEWEEVKADQFIDADRLKIFALLAGALVWHSSKGVLNLCENLDWKRAFALHLWYFCLPSATITEALLVYDKAFKGDTSQGIYACQPRPPYLENPFEYSEYEDSEFVIYDMCYHLLHLYSERSYPLDKVLVPTSSTLYQLDYRLSWHLSQVLLSLQYSHLSEYQWSCLHTSFAAQLETLEMWHWAAFVLLHIHDENRRQIAVKELLCRHVSLSREEWKKEEILINKFHIPKIWLHQAKALRAKYENRPHDEAWHLLKAEMWNDCHTTVVESLAADAINNENYDYLKSFLVEFAPAERSSTIKDWSTRGQVFLDYINLVEAVEDLKKDDVSAYDIERLHPEIMSLSNRIGLLHCHTAIDRLCSAEMSKKTVNLLHIVLYLQNKPILSGLNWSVPTRLMAPSLNKLPLPEDSRLQELRSLTRRYLLETTA